MDRFILARLEKEGLDPSPEADKAALLRRVSFDLTGLPPTAEELQAFLADDAPDAYEKQVDRLLASPHYGERWAASWLELARYADSKGYEQDQLRLGVWPYRDWVIDAYNRNLSYDKFVITQLAGDLLPNATFQDRIATSFHRQTPGNDEGGTDDEEFRLVAVMDRVATTWSVLNGVTFNCVQCHSHPYDPIRHAEYYKFLGFFNTSRDTDLRNDYPVLRVPKDKARIDEAAHLQDEMVALRKAVIEAGRQADASAGSWTLLPITAGTANEVLGYERLLERYKAGDLVSDASESFYENENAPPKEVQKEVQKALKDSISDARKTLVHLKAANQTSRAAGAGQAFAVPLQLQEGEARTFANTPGLSVFELTAQANIPAMTALRIEVRPKSPAEAQHTPENGFLVNQIDAWLIHPDGHEEKIVFRYLVPDSELNLETNLQRLVRGTVTAQGGAPPDAIQRLAQVSAFAANPKLFQTRWVVAIPTMPLTLAAGSRIRVQLTQIQFIDDKPAPVQHVRLLASGDSKWTALVGNATLSSNIARCEDLARQLDKIPAVSLPVMAEQASYEGRQTREFERGNFLTKIGPALAPAVPGLFPKLPADVPRNRLTMAQWFFKAGQPLTARVAVNRYWEQMFGVGIVETLEDFGSVGEKPSHPELLDWLALHFQNDLHWDMKALLREMVTSATYRQAAKVTAAKKRKDPRNRLLSRGPQQRLTAEMVRDQALLAGGLLTATVGGPSVMPPQPAGLWNSVANLSKWVDATGPDRYRRAIYTFLKRSAIYPSFTTFDASAHVVSMPRRVTTNTPLQALVTLNDPVYTEAAAALARRMTKEATLKMAFGSPAGAAPGADDLTGARIRYGARLVLSREPTDHELTVLHALYQKAFAVVEAPPAKAGGRLTLIPADRDLAALASVASAIFNLDSALTR